MSSSLLLQLGKGIIPFSGLTNLLLLQLTLGKALDLGEPIFILINHLGVFKVHLHFIDKYFGTIVIYLKVKHVFSINFGIFLSYCL